jgi:hypothetical protein
MIESPVLQEFIAETKQKYIIDVLTARFGPAAEPFAEELKTIADDRLDQILKFAATCRSRTSFRKQLASL